MWYVAVCSAQQISVVYFPRGHWAEVLSVSVGCEANACVYTVYVCVYIYIYIHIYIIYICRNGHTNVQVDSVQAWCNYQERYVKISFVKCMLINLISAVCVSFSFRYWENSLVELLIIEAIANCLDVGLRVGRLPGPKSPTEKSSELSKSWEYPNSWMVMENPQ